LGFVLSAPDGLTVGLLSKKMMMMATIIVHSYSGFRELYGQIIRGHNTCDECGGYVFRISDFVGGGGVEAVLTEVFTTFSSAFRKTNTLIYIFVFSFPKLSNASKGVLISP